MKYLIIGDYCKDVFIYGEANTIAKTTRRGKGNIMICSSDVASALAMAGILDYNGVCNLIAGTFQLPAAQALRAVSS